MYCRGGDQQRSGGAIGGEREHRAHPSGTFDGEAGFAYDWRIRRPSGGSRLGFVADVMQRHDKDMTKNHAFVGSAHVFAERMLLDHADSSGR